MKLIKDRNIYFLLFLLILYGIVNYFVIINDRSYFMHDSMGFFLSGANLSQAVRKTPLFIIPKLLFDFYLHGTAHKAPFFIISSVPFYLIFGESKVVASCLVNILFLSIMVFSIYFLVSKLKSKKCAVLACLILLLFPAIMGHSRLYWLEFPLTCMVSLSICLLVYTNKFNNMVFSILFGVSLGLGLLTKQSFLIFVLPCLLYIIYRLLKDGSLFAKKNNFINLFVSLGIGLLIAATWYLPNRRINLDYLSRVMLVDSSNYFSSKFYHYLMSLKNIHLHSFYLLIFIFCLLLFFIKTKKEEGGKLILCWSICPFILYVIIRVPPDPRYTLPILPAIAVFISMEAERFKNKKLVNIVYSVFIVGGLLNLIYLVTLKKNYYTSLSYSLNSFEREGLIAPNKTYFPIEEIISVVSKTYRGECSKVAVIPSFSPISYGLMYHSSIRDLPFTIEQPVLSPFMIGGKFIDNDSYLEVVSAPRFILRYDYIIMSPDSIDSAGMGSEGVFPELEKKVLSLLRINFSRNIHHFILLRKFNTDGLPELLVYKKINS